MEIRNTSIVISQNTSVRKWSPNKNTNNWDLFDTRNDNHNDIEYERQMWDDTLAY